MNSFSTATADYNHLYRANSETTGINSVQRRGGNFVFINSGLQTCTSDQEWIPEQPASEPEVVDNEGIMCTHRPQFVDQVEAVAACKTFGTEPNCEANTKCQVRRFMCRFDKMWIVAKELKPTSTKWYSTTDDLKGYDYVLTSLE